MAAGASEDDGAAVKINGCSSRLHDVSGCGAAQREHDVRKHGGLCVRFWWGPLDHWRLLKGIVVPELFGAFGSFVSDMCGSCRGSSFESGLGILITELWARK